jgi:hypothetical protein
MLNQETIVQIDYEIYNMQNRLKTIGGLDETEILVTFRLHLATFYSSHL